MVVCGQYSPSHTLTFVWVFFFIFPFYVCFPNVCSSYMKFLASQNANIEQSHMLVFIPFTVIVNFRLCLFILVVFFTWLVFAFVYFLLANNDDSLWCWIINELAYCFFMAKLLHSKKLVYTLLKDFVSPSHSPSLFYFSQLCIF